MTQVNKYFRVGQTYNRVSMAVRLTDDYTREQPVGKVAVFLKDRETEAVKNHSGYHIFMDLPAGHYTLVIKSDYYFSQETDVDTGSLDPASPVVNVILQPNTVYPFPAGSTSVRAVVHGSGGNALEGASVKATIMLPEAAVKARVGQDGCTAGSLFIKLQNLKGELNAGDVLMIKDSNSSHLEFCEICSPLPASPADPFESAGPLKFNHASGIPLYIMVNDSILNTRTTEKGEVVIYFTLVKVKKFLVRLQVNYPNYQTAEREVEVCEGSLTSLGIIQLSTL